MSISKILQLCVAIFGCLYAQFSAAEDVFYLGYEQGEFEVEGADYRPDTSVTGLVAGFTNNQYTLQLNSYELEFDDAIDGTDVFYSEIEGYSLQVGKAFRLFAMLELEVAYGRFWWETRDAVSDVQVGKQSGADRLLEALVSVNLGQAALYVSRKQMRDVAGNDLDVTTLGLRYLFK